eukprot:PhF_6_TR6209/c0_g1_i1/m.9347
MGCGASKEQTELTAKRLDKIETMLTEIRNAQPPQQNGGNQLPHHQPAAHTPNPLAPPPPSDTGLQRRSSLKRPSISFDNDLKTTTQADSHSQKAPIESPPAHAKPKRTLQIAEPAPAQTAPTPGSVPEKVLTPKEGNLRKESITPISPAETHKPKNEGGIKFVDEGAQPKKGGDDMDRSLRKVQQNVKNVRRHFFEKFITTQDVIDRQPIQLKCGWLGCAAMAISFLLDNSGTQQISVDELFATNNLALHYTNFTSVCMAELFDIVHEFITTNPKCVSANMDAENISFDLETLEAVEETDEYSGDHAPVVSLSAFRKELTADMTDTNSVHVFNYDPFVVQEANAKMEEEDDEDDDVSPSPKGDTSKVRKWQKKNMGAFAVLLGFNTTLHEAEIATVYLGSEVHVTVEKASLQTLYNACCVKDGYTKRPRGYIKISRDNKKAKGNAAPTIFPVRLLDGSTSKGQLSIALDPQISPHILGLGLACHLAKETLLPQRLTTKGTRDQLRGIAVSDICETLKLPLHVVTAGSNKESLHNSFAYLSMYFAAKGLGGDVHLGVVPISRKDNAADGAPSLTMDEFESQLWKLTKDAGIIMLLNFDINTAQNVTGLEVKGEASHFGIVSKYDPTNKVLTIADVSVKKFKKQWSAPMARIYSACIGYGYLLISNKLPEVKGNGAPRYGQDILSNAKFSLPPQVNRPLALLEFPPKSYCITLIAYVLHIMSESVTVEDICYGSGIHLSFLLSDHLSLNDVVRIARRFISTRVDGGFVIEATNLDKLTTGNRRKSLDEFRNLIKEYATKKPYEAVLVLNFSAVFIQSKGNVWNGSYGGSYAIVTSFDEKTDTIVVADANPEKFYRHWKCPINVMYDACCAMDPISDRAKGYFTISRSNSVSKSQGYGIDIRNCMLHHPFKPPLSSQVTGIAAAVSELCEVVSPEEVIYSFYTNAEGTVDKQFSLMGLSASLTMVTLKNMCEKLIARRNYPLELNMYNDFKLEQDFKRAISTAGAYNMCIVIYDVTTLWDIGGQSWTGAALVEHLGENSVKLVDACPTRYGESWSTSYETLWAACNRTPAMQGVITLKVRS